MARLPYLSRDQVPADGQPFWDALAGQERGRLPLIAQVLMQRPPLAARIEELNRMVRFDLSLTRAEAELVVLAVARELDCMRAWGIHVPQGKDVGVREEAIEALKTKQAPAGLTDDEAELVAFAQELVRHKRVSAATFARVRDRRGDLFCVDLAAIVGVYCMLSALMNAFGIEPPEDPALVLPL